MHQRSAPAGRVRFGPFELDPRTGELHANGAHVVLSEQPLRLLLALLDRPGQLVTRDELRQRLWPDDTFVDFEHGLNAAVRRVRDALGDSADSPRYVETLPRRGYRFVAEIEPGPVGAQEEGADTRPPTTEPPVVSAALRGEWWKRSKSIFVSIFLIITAAAIWYAVGSRSTAEPLRAVPLTSLQGVVRAPSLSPDGNYVVFTWTGEKQDNPDLYVQQVGAGNPFQLTTDPGNDYSPSWSPDGRTIAFLRGTPDATHSEVWLTAPLGGSERKLVDLRSRLPMFTTLSIGWCPDSSCVLVTDSRGAGHPDALFVVALESGEKRELTHPAGLAADVDPAVSPDGRSVVFRRNTTPFSGQFYRLSLTNGMVPEGEPVRITSTRHLTAGKPSWLPDGREILFPASGGLWRLNPFGGGTPTRLPFVGQDGHDPVVSRTAAGRLRLVYKRHFSDGNVWRVDTGASGGGADSAPVAAIASTRADYFPNLSPDDRRIAFASDRSGELQIWVADTDGSHAVQLPLLASSTGAAYPRWSPDGKTIVFHGDPAGRPDVMVVPASGGKPRILTTEMANGGLPSFSRDGRWIYFCVVEDANMRVWKIPVSGGAAVQVTKDAGTFAIESHDGRDLYYVEAADRPSLALAYARCRRPASQDFGRCAGCKLRCDRARHLLHRPGVRRIRWFVRRPARRGHTAAVLRLRHRSDLDGGSQPWRGDRAERVARRPYRVLLAC